MQKVIGFSEYKSEIYKLRHDMVLCSSKSNEIDKVFPLISAADKDADSLFLDIIRRKEKADSTRNALTILNRFKFLFYLPSTIK